MWVHFVQKWFPEAQVLLCQQGVKLSVSHCKIKFWFSVIDPPHSLGLLQSEADIIVMSKRVRHVQGQDWIMRPAGISHTKAGGATDGTWTFLFMSKALIFQS